MLSERLSHALVRFTATLVSDYVAEAALDELMELVPAELAVDGAGIMLYDDDDELRFVSASDDTVRLIERFQVETGEGPCVAAAQTGQVIIAEDLRGGDDRFPRFAPLAAEAGLVSVHSFPLTVEGTRIGALNLYRSAPGGLSESEWMSAAIVSDMAAAYLIAARRVDHVTRMLERTRQAMDRNAPIEQAKGYVALALGVSPQEAYGRLRAHARHHRERSIDVATRILEGALQPADLPDEPD